LAGALYIPLLLLVFFPQFISKYCVLLIIVFSILIAAPVADVFRSANLDDIDLLQNFNLDFFFAGHFDAYQNLVQVIELNFSSKGWQVVGALLFWIPRAVWPNKPIGTSFEFGEFLGLPSSNVSFPLTAELFVDFGLLGVILGMFLLGIIYKGTDNFLSKPQEPGSLVGYIFAIGQLELAILSIYLLRGNVLSTLAFTSCVAFSLILLLMINGALRGLSTEMALQIRASR